MRTCPVDDFTLKSESYEGVTIDVCPHCGGVWLDQGELEQLQANQDDDFRGLPTSVMDTVSAAVELGKAASEAPRRCVTCADPLIKKEYGFASQVMIDQCPKGHGMWLDKGELARLEMYYENESDLADLMNQVKDEERSLAGLLGRIWKGMRG